MARRNTKPVNRISNRERNRIKEEARQRPGYGSDQQEQQRRITKPQQNRNTTTNTRTSNGRQPGLTSNAGMQQANRSGNDYIDWTQREYGNSLSIIEKKQIRDLFRKREEARQARNYNDYMTQRFPREEIRAEKNFRRKQEQFNNAMHKYYDTAHGIGGNKRADEFKENIENGFQPKSGMDKLPRPQGSNASMTLQKARTLEAQTGQRTPFNTDPSQALSAYAQKQMQNAQRDRYETRDDKLSFSEWIKSLGNDYVKGGRNTTPENVTNFYGQLERGIQRGKYKDSKDFYLQSDEEQRRRAEEAQARATQTREWIDSHLPQTEEEMQALREQAEATNAKPASWIDANGLDVGYSNPSAGRTYQETIVHKRPDDYEDGNNSYQYDRILYDAIYGDGSYEQRMDEIQTDEDDDLFQTEIDDLWDRLENGTLHELDEQNTERQQAHKEAIMLTQNTDLGAQQAADRYKKEVEKDKRISDLTLDVPEKVDYDPSINPGYAVYEDQDDYTVLPKGDKADAAYFYVNHSYSDEQQLINDYLAGQMNADMDPDERAAAVAAMRQYNPNDVPAPEQMRDEWFLLDTSNDLTGGLSEKDIFNQFYESGRKDEAMAYLDGMRSTLQERKRKAIEYYSRETARLEMNGIPVGGIAGLGATIAKPIANIPEGIDILGTLLGVKGAGDINGDWHRLGNQIRALRDERGNVWDEAAVNIFGENAKGVGKEYNAALYSILDNAVALGIASKTASVLSPENTMKALTAGVQTIMSSSAGADEFARRVDSGMNPDEAAVYAVGQAIIEAVTEKYSVEALFSMNFKDMIGNLKQLGKFWARNFLAEGSEEVASDVLSLVMDDILSTVNEHKSDFEERLDNLREYMSEADAQKQAVSEVFQQFGKSFWFGGLSGLVMSGGRYVGNVISQSRLGSSINSTNSVTDDDATTQMLKMANELGEGTQSIQQAQKIQELIDAGKKPSNRQMGQLAQNIQIEAQEKYEQTVEETVRDNVQEALQDAGVTDNVEELTDIVTKAETEGYDKLTQQEKQTLNDSAEASGVLEQINSDDNFFNKVSEDIRERTKGLRDAMNSAANLMRGRTSEGINVKSVGQQLATEEDIRNAQGEKTTGGRAVIVDGTYGTLEGSHIVEEDGRMVPKFTVTVDGQEQEVDASDIKATKFTTAAVIREQAIAPNIYSSGYTNLLINQIDSNNIQNVGQYLSDAWKIRWSAYLGQEAPQTNIPQNLASEIYSQSVKDYTQEWQDYAKKRPANYKGAGQGTVTFGDIAYNTKEFDQKIEGLDRQQQTRIRMIADWAQMSGVDLRFEDRSTLGENWNWRIHGSQSNNNITINLDSYDRGSDAQAGQNRHHIVVTFGHEMTHWLQQNNRSGYIQLKDFVISSLQDEGVNVAARASDIMESRRRNGNDISMMEAVDEIVANACDQVLGNPETVQYLKENNNSLYQKIKSFVQNLVSRIKSAITGMEDSASYDSRMLMYRYGNRLAKLWLGAYDDVLSGQIRNMEAQNMEMRFSQADDAEDRQIKIQINNHMSEIMAMDPVADISSKVNLEYYKQRGAKNDNAAWLAWAVDYIKKLGNVVERENFGTVNFSKNNISDGFRYRMNSAQKAAFMAVPDVIQKGIEINYHSNHKNRGNTDTHTIAAKILIDGQERAMGVVVKLTRELQRYKTHKVFLPNGRVLTIENEAEPGSAKSENNSRSLPRRSASTETIAQTKEKRNMSMAEDTSDWKTYTVRNGEMYSRDQNGNTVKLEGQDRAYVEAWQRGDFRAMEDMLAERIRERGAVPFKTPNSYSNPNHTWVANAIKDNNMYAIRQAAAEMAEMIPDNAVLVPMPDHYGVVNENTDTMILANEIAKIKDVPVIKALEGIARESRRENKAKPKSQQMTVADLGFRQVEEIPDGKVPYIVDNVIASGLTAQAAHEALGNNGVTIAYAKSIRSANAGLKRANVTFYDTNKQYGNYLIPLSERIDMSKTGFKGTKFSMSEDDHMDVNAWMQSQTDSTLQTEGERQLLKAYKDLRMALRVTEEKISNYSRQIKTLEAKQMLLPDERRTLQELRNKLDVNEQKQARLEEELYEVTSSEGYAGMMYKTRRLISDHVEGKTLAQVMAAVDDMRNEAERVEKEIAKREKELKGMAEGTAIRTIRNELSKRGLTSAAEALRNQYNSAMSRGELEGRLAEIVLKKVNGEDAQADIDALVNDVMTNQVGWGNEEADAALSEMRGMTIEIGPGQQAELKATHGSLKEIRQRTKGSGVKFVYGKNSTLDQNADELQEQFPALRGQLENEKDSLENFVSYVEGLLQMKKGNAEDLGIDENEVKMFIDAMTNVMLNGELGGMSAENLLERIRKEEGLVGKALNTVQEARKSAEALQISGRKAAGWASFMQRDVAAALDYFNKTAKQAAEVERQRVRKNIIEQLRSDHTKELIEQQQRYEELMKKDRRARELKEDNDSLRKVITTDISRFKKRLTEETDQKNIPEEAKPLARIISKMLVNHDMAGFRRVLNAEKVKLADYQMRLMKMDAMFGPFDADSDLDWLVVKATDPADNDYSLRDKVLQDLIDIEQGLVEYRNAEGKGVVTLRDRNAALQKIQEAVSEIYSVIKARSEAEIEGRKWQIYELAEMLQADMAESRFKGEYRGKGSRMRNNVVNAVGYGNLTPEYFIKNLRNRTMTLLHSGLQSAENRAGLEARRAQQRIAQIAQENGYATWDGQEVHKIQVAGGRTINITTEQLMSLYATWIREQNQLRPEETAHLLRGGFVLAEKDTTEGKPRREKIETRPIRMDKISLAMLQNELTPEQVKYVHDIVDYMSNELAELGNEASMKTYGIKKFTEKFYFPIKSWGGVLNKSSASGTNSNNDNRAMRQSFTKRLTNNAQNAIEISDFTPTAIKHVVGMINFNTVGPAVENMNKVLNQQLKYGMETEEEDDTYKRNMRAAFQEAYGKNAYDYLVKFMEDVNGGVSRRMDISLKEKLLSVFRKGAVAGSLSVAAQQPLSYIRAAMEINPKYLAQALSPEHWGRIHDELTKYSGIAVIKDMGRFDMNQGQSMVEFITPEAKTSKAKAVWTKISDSTTMLPQKTDALTWGRMWIACKLEQAALHPEMDTKSDAFLKMTAERFNEVMRKTQVYDSVMVKSQNMRSKNYAIKAMTSFMAEPTLSLNVLADAVQNYSEKGGKANLANAGATFIMSAVMQALVKALMSSGRTPDKKKTWKEQFLAKWLSMFMSEANPASLIPGYSDMIELLKNGELKDDAMGVIGKFKTITETMMNWATGKSDNHYRNVEDTVGQIAQLFTDVPLKNLMRDARAMYNFFNPDTYAKRDTSGAVIKYSMLDAIHSADNLAGVINSYLTKADAGYKDTVDAYVKRILNAQKAGNTQKAEEMSEYLKLAKIKAEDPEKTLQQKLNALAKKDKNMSAEEKTEYIAENSSEAGANNYIIQQLKKGEISAATARKELKKIHPDKTEDDIWWKVDRIEYQRETGKEVSGNAMYYRLDDAMNANKAEDIRTVTNDLLKHGVEAKKIADHASDWKSEYLAADENGKRRIRDAIHKLYKALGLTTEEADKRINKWKPKKEEKKDGSSLLPENRTRAAGIVVSDVGYGKDKNDTTGRYGEGTIDLNNRQVVHNADGSISTERSMSFYDEDTGKEILIPTVVNGRIVSDDEAIDHYYETKKRDGIGEYLGMFDTWQEADAYAEKLHKRQDWYYHR